MSARRAAFLAATLALASSSTAEAQPSPSTEAVHARTLAYFAAEKREGAAFMAAGAAGGAASVFLLTHRDSDVARGAAVPIIAVSAIQLLVGGGVYFRTDAQVAELEALLAEDPAAFRARELERMRAVDFWFGVYRWTEIALFAAGVGMVVAGAAADLPFLEGAGYGLGIESALMLGLDALAEARAERYIEALEGLHVGAAPALGPDGTLTAGGSLLVSGRF